MHCFWVTLLKCSLYHLFKDEFFTKRLKFKLTIKTIYFTSCKKKEKDKSIFVLYWKHSYLIHLCLLLLMTFASNLSKFYTIVFIMAV